MRLWQKHSFCYCFLLLFLGFPNLQHIQAKSIEKRGLMDNIGEGIKYAGQMFGINTAADVANLVAKAFSGTSSQSTRTKPTFDLTSFFKGGQQKPESDESNEQQQQQHNHAEHHQHANYENEDNDGDGGTQPTKENSHMDLAAPKLISGILRMVGFDARRLGALALNALIMIAQAIGSTFISKPKNKMVISAVDGGRLFAKDYLTPEQTGPEALYSHKDHEPRQLRNGTPLDWFLENPPQDMKNLITDMTDNELPERIVNMIDKVESESGQDAGCIKMLMCKSKPFIWGMQKSLGKRLGFKAVTSKEPKTDNQTVEKKMKSMNEEEQQEEAEEDTKFNVAAFYTYMPSLEEFREHSKNCEQRFGNFCDVERLYPWKQREQKN